MYILCLLQLPIRLTNLNMLFDPRQRYAYISVVQHELVQAIQH